MKKCSDSRTRPSSVSAATESGFCIGWSPGFKEDSPRRHGGHGGSRRCIHAHIVAGNCRARRSDLLLFSVPSVSPWFNYLSLRQERRVDLDLIAGRQSV